MLLDDLVNRPSAGRFTKSPYTTGVRQPGTNASHSPTNPLPMLLDDLVNRPSAGRFTKSPYTTGVRQPGTHAPRSPQHSPRLPHQSFAHVVGRFGKSSIRRAIYQIALHNRGEATGNPRLPFPHQSFAHVVGRFGKSSIRRAIYQIALHNRGEATGNQRPPFPPTFPPVAPPILCPCCWTIW